MVEMSNGKMRPLSRQDFKADYWTDLTSTISGKCLIFEGAGEGKGELDVVLLDQSGNEIAQGNKVWLDIKNIKKMYVRGKAKPEDPSGLRAPFLNIAAAGNTSQVSWVPDPIKSEWVFEKSLDEEGKVIVFVNGSNESYWESSMRVETMFKRLWWQGYKGRFAYFRWDTLVGYDNGEYPIGQYNENEWRAWTYGPALKQFVEHLPPDLDRNVISHSLGNAVVGSALGKGMQVNNEAVE